jgi:Ca2+-binding EF-hand superfamily protein
MKTYLQILMLLVLPAAVALAQLPPSRNNAPNEAPPAGPPNGPAGPGQPGGFAGPPPNAMFAAIDVDADGVITKNELRRAVAQLRKLDTDQDGNLTLAEVSPAGPVGPAGPAGPAWDINQYVSRLMENDKNADGKLSADEITDTVRPLIDGADQNADGIFDRAELTVHVQNMRNRAPGGAGAFPGGPGGPGGFADRQIDANQLTAQLLRSDRNGDGRLTRDEVPPQAMGMLQGGDQNGDGAIDAREMQIIMRRMGNRARALGPALGPNADDRTRGRAESRRNRQRTRDGNEAPTR